ncbi:MAG: glycosyltransferase family 39 protein [Patescibacteria group bacterium]
MEKFHQTIGFKFILVIALGLAISFLGYRLREKHFSAFPTINDTGDEYKYAFNGISLIKNGVPESWSWWDNYGEFPVVRLGNMDFRMVKPYFDEPPLFSLLMGSYAMSEGMDSYEKVDPGALRWPMLKLGTVNVFLLFLLVYFCAGLSEAVLASLLYATIPTMVLSSRLPLAENFMVTLSLAALLLLLLFVKTNSKLVLVLMSLTAVSGILVKQTALYIPVAIIFLLLAKKKLKPALVVFGFIVLAYLAWFAYGAYYNWDLFITLQQVFSGREIKMPTMIINLFDTFRITEKTMSADGIMIWGVVSLILYSFVKDTKSKFTNLFLPVLTGSYLVLFSIMSAHIKGWYRIPFHPFFAWAIAAVFIEIVKKPKFLYTFFFLAVAFFASMVAGTGEQSWSQVQVKLYQVIFPLTLAPVLFYEIANHKCFKYISQVLLILSFALLIRFNIKAIFFFQDQFWY